MRVLPLVAILLVAGGCAATGTTGAGPGVPRATGTAEPQPAWASCDAAGAPTPAENPAEAVTLPFPGADFEPTAVVVCRVVPERRPDGGEDLMLVEGRTDAPGDVTSVLGALRLGTESRTVDACSADLPGVAWFALVDAAGRWVRPGVPTDACGKIRIEVRQAVERLALRRVAARPVRELESSGAAASGCTQQWADMVWATGPERKAARAEDPFAPDTALRVCVYTVPAGEQGSGKPAGTFERGLMLPADRRPALTAALRKTTTASGCTTPAGRFALIRPADDAADDGAGIVYAELDGCRRVLIETADGSSGLGQADPSLVALLA